MLAKTSETIQTQLMNFKAEIIKATKEINETDNNMDYYKTCNPIQSGLAYVKLSNLIDDLLLDFRVNISVESQLEYHSTVGDLLYLGLKTLRKLSIFFRNNAEIISETGSLYSFAKKEAASYIELYAIICTKRNKNIVLNFIQKKSFQECKSIKEYLTNQPNRQYNSRSRDAVYQIIRLNLSSKIYLMSIFKFIKNTQSELVQDMAKFLPFRKKFGYREKYFSSKKLFLHKFSINVSVLGIVDCKNNCLTFPKSNTSVKLSNVPLKMLQNLDGKNVIVTGLYDGEQSIFLNSYSKTGTYGWLAEFFGISSGLDPSPFYSGNPIIELI